MGEHQMQTIRHIFFISVDTCAALQLSNFTEKNTSHVLVGTNVLVTCCTGYVFPDFLTERVSKCLANQSWSETIPECMREHRYIISLLGR